MRDVHLGNLEKGFPPYLRYFRHPQVQLFEEHEVGSKHFQFSGASSFSARESDNLRLHNLNWEFLFRGCLVLGIIVLDEGILPG